MPASRNEIAKIAIVRFTARAVLCKSMPKVMATDSTPERWTGCCHKHGEKCIPAACCELEERHFTESQLGNYDAKPGFQWSGIHRTTLGSSG